MTLKNVPFFRPSIGDAEIDKVVACLRSGWLTTGPNAAAFEEEFAAYLGGNVGAVTVNSATAALHLGLEALGVGPGDEVIVPTLTFTATAEVVRYMGARPVFVDIDPTTLCLDTNAVQAAITAKCKVIMPVHFAGRSCDMAALRKIADDNGLKILDDAAHALPTRFQGALIGTVGADATAFSFYANKTMTTGEGGMLVSADPTLLARARTMRMHGIDRDVFDRFTNKNAGWSYDIVAAGYKYNMTDIAAAMGRVQLGRLNEFYEKRQDLADRYHKAFSDLPVSLPPPPAAGDTHSWHLYILQLNEEAPCGRDEFIEALRSSGVGTSVHYKPLHQMSYWKAAAKGQNFAYADAYFSRCVSLPLFMDMSDAEHAFVVAAVRAALGT